MEKPEKPAKYGLRLFYYVLATLMLLGLCVLFEKPIARYIRDIQTATLITERQRALIATQTRTTTIEQILARFEQTHPPYTRVRVGLLHNGRGIIDGIAPAQWDIVAGFVVNGSSPPVLSDRPLSEWNSYIGSMLADQCTTIRRSSLQNDIVKTRMTETRTAALIACPITDAKKQLLGAIFGAWDDDTPIPSDIEALQKTLDAVADEIAASIKPPD
jgi:hypothetical protein